MRRYKGDPYWKGLRHACNCKKCGRLIPKGEDVFYFPSCNQVYCNEDGCGERYYLQFLSEAGDEEGIPFAS